MWTRCQVTAVLNGDSKKPLLGDTSRCFLGGSCRGHITSSSSNPRAGGVNTSTVTLRVVGGDEKGSLKSETVKYGRESQGTRI
jgi:hypothetical protein